MKNPVVHFEILGAEGANLIELYRGLFGWPIEDNSLPGWPHYGFPKADQGIGGAVGTADAQSGSAVAAGATIATPITTVPGAALTVAP
jgi:predicted enzyme related to lactoylglutathione lyase